MRLFNILCVSLVLILMSCKSENQEKETKQETEKTKKQPNIVLIYLDDLGYGDLSSYGASALETPNIDKLANEGMKFTRGYATSATCTPSRYAILTGIYPWKNKDAKILPGTAPLIIDPKMETLPKALKENGYNTAVVGKWHLGLGLGNVDWNKQVKPGPNEVGFDYSYIMAATQDRVPTVYLKNGLVENLDPEDPISISYQKNFEGEPTGTNNPEMLNMIGDPQHSNSIVNGVSRIGYMKGGEAARWSDVDMADQFLNEAKNYVIEQKDNNKPFFLYYAMQQPHVPRIPNPRFEGTSSLGPRGDVIVEADWAVGEFMKTLKENDLLENTLVIFTSDNGPVLDDGYEDQAIELLGDHDPSGNLRGGKYSLFEAGTRVPFITYWKGTIQPGVSNALVSQLDLMSSLTALIGNEVEAQDSKNIIDVFLGKSNEGREDLIIEATTRTAYINGDYVFIPPYDGPEFLPTKGIETGSSKDLQLYDLSKDTSQEDNLAEKQPKKLEEMKRAFEALRGDNFGRIEQIKFEN
jgi:arylsulfatase A-like enzyme